MDTPRPTHPDTALPLLTPAERVRYHRHILLPSLGETGQRRLRAARILLVGAGGLGAPAALYLAAAGVGTLGLAEFDTVDITNLQRQILYGESDVGHSKLAAATRQVRRLNSGVCVKNHSMRLDASNAAEIIARYDIVVDGSDNFATHYLINDACVLLGRPCVHGSIHRFEGQISVFAYNGGPCYRCLFPAPPEPGSVSNCAEAGVLGVLPGIVGSIQATEAIKIAADVGTSLSGRLLVFDALGMQFREIRLRRSVHCPVCGNEPVIRSIHDTRATCSSSTTERKPVSVPELDVKTLKTRLDANDNIQLIDVREPHERELCHIGGELIPVDQIPAQIERIDRTRDVIIYCRTGVRSAQVVSWLLRNGFDNVWNLRGGLHAWSREIDPTVPRY